MLPQTEDARETFRVSWASDLSLSQIPSFLIMCFARFSLISRRRGTSWDINSRRFTELAGQLLSEFREFARPSDRNEDLQVLLEIFETSALCLVARCSSKYPNQLSPSRQSTYRAIVMFILMGGGRHAVTACQRADTFLIRSTASFRFANELA